MKKSKIAILLVFALTLMFGIYSCQESGNEVQMNNQTDNDIADMYLPDLDDFSSDIIDGTLETEIILVVDEEDLVYYDAKDNNVQCGDKKKRNYRKYYFGKILRKLGLTREQKKEIHNLKSDFKDCIKLAKKEIHKRKRAIIKAANAEKREICKRKKAGEITYREARQLIKELNARTREALAALYPAQEILDCICEYMENIISILDNDQADLLIEWLEENIPELDCDFGDDGPPPPPDF